MKVGLIRECFARGLLAGAMTFCAAAATAQSQEMQDRDRQYATDELGRDWVYGMGASAGWTFWEKDEKYLGQQTYGIHLDYHFAPQWTYEFLVAGMPDVRARQSVPFPADDTWGMRFHNDFLWHTKSDGLHEDWDPYLAGGIGVDVFDDAKPYWQAGGGFGAFYNFDNNWYIRPDYRLLAAFHYGEIHQVALLSIGYRWPVERARRDAGAAAVAAAETLEAQKVLGTVFFAFDSSALTDQAKAQLRQNADWLKANPNQPVMIQGHADERGTAEYNLALGQRRADSVFQYLQALGVSTDRLRTISYGEEYPADPAHTPEAWAKNRRVEFAFDGERAVPRRGGEAL